MSRFAFDGDQVAVWARSQPKIDVFTVRGELYETIPLRSNTSRVESLAISDGSVYWYENDGYLYRYNLATGVRSVLYQVDDPFFSSIKRIVAGGDHILWDEGLNGGTLKLCTVSTGKIDTIHSSSQMMYGLAIDGDRALFGCRRTDGGSGREIHIYSISGKEDHIIPESRSEGTWGYGDLSGDLVAWTKTDGPLSASATSAEIMVTDLADSSTTAVVHLDRIETPRIQEDTVYWVEKESGDSSEGVIHAYDLQSGESNTLVTGVTALCDVRNGYALWLSYSPYALWTTQLPGDAPVATQPATPPHTETAATPPQGSPHTLWLLGAGLVGLLLVSGVAALWRRQE